MTDRLNTEAKRVYELALREALQLGHNYVGTEHLLLGLMREEHSTASRVLREGFDLDLAKIRDAVIDYLRNAHVFACPNCERDVYSGHTSDERIRCLRELRKRMIDGQD